MNKTEFVSLNTIGNISVASTEENHVEDTLKYQEIKIEHQGNGLINGITVPKFHGTINISCDYTAEELLNISKRIVNRHTEISDKSIIMMEFIKDDDSIKDLNYGLVKRVDGIWETNVNTAYLSIRDYNKETEKKNTVRTWQEYSKELANGGKILGIYSYVGTTYMMIYEKSGKYYLHEFDVSSLKNSRDELVKTGSSRFKYRNGDYDDIFVIKGNRLITYMPDPFNPSQLFEADEWIRID